MFQDRDVFAALLVFLACVGTILLTGCGDEEKPETPVTIGTLKWQGVVPAAPKAPGVGIPFVKEVGYYADWQLTKEVIDTVAPGKTLSKIVFSDPMRHVVADEKTARPILYYKMDKKLTRFRVVKHGAKLQSGDAKPRGKGTTAFICKYTLPTNGRGVFTVAIGKLSTDEDGNMLAGFYTHREKLQIGEDPAEKMTEGPMKDIRPRTVRLVYFRPKNYPVRQDRASVMRRLITDARNITPMKCRDTDTETEKRSR